MSTPDWRLAGERLLGKVLELAESDSLPSLPVFEPEHVRSELVMRPTGRRVLLVADGRRIEFSPGQDEAFRAVAISDTLRSVVRGNVEFMRTYRDGPLGLIGRRRQSTSGSEFQPYAPGGRRMRRFPIRLFSIGHNKVAPIDELRDLFIHERAARRHHDLASLAEFEVESFYLSEPRYTDW